MRIVLFGDSVFAGHGLARRHGPAARLGSILGDGVEVVDAGIPDQTSADGLGRAGRVRGDVVMIGFGLNDAIRGVPRTEIGANFRGLRVAFGRRGLLVEMLVPRASRWPAVTDLTGVAADAAGGRPFVPDVLRGLPEHGMVQTDGLHPDEAGAARVAELLASELTRLRGEVA